MAELELSAISRQYFARRILEIGTLSQELDELVKEEMLWKSRLSGNLQLIKQGKN